MGQNQEKFGVKRLSVVRCVIEHTSRLMSWFLPANSLTHSSRHVALVISVDFCYPSYEFCINGSFYIMEFRWHKFSSSDTLLNLALLEVVFFHRIQPCFFCGVKWCIHVSFPISMMSRNQFLSSLSAGDLKEQPSYAPPPLFPLTCWCPARTRLAVSQFFLSSVVYGADRSRHVTVRFCSISFFHSRYVNIRVGCASLVGTIISMEIRWTISEHCEPFFFILYSRSAVNMYCYQ
jgi:hypothetical protein